MSRRRTKTSFRKNHKSWNQGLKHKHYVKFSKAIHQEALQLYCSGLSMRSIALRLGVGATIVHGWVDFAGLERHEPTHNTATHTKPKSPYPPFIHERAISLYKTGLSAYAIAQEFGVAGQTILNWLITADVPRRATSLKSRFVGKNHPNWKGGTSSQRVKAMNTTEYKAWRTEVYKRDKWTCQNCGQVGGGLHAHHILGYAKYPTLRLTPKNGITLCVSCHSKLHKRCIFSRKQA